MAPPITLPSSRLGLPILSLPRLSAGWRELLVIHNSGNEFKVNTIVKVADGAKTVFWKDDWHEAGNMETLFLDINNLVLHQ